MKTKYNLGKHLPESCVAPLEAPPDTAIHVSSFCSTSWEALVIMSAKSIGQEISQLAWDRAGNLLARFNFSTYPPCPSRERD